MKIGKEDIQSIIFYDWIIYKKLDDITFHVGNERTVSPQAGSIFKRKGIKPGVSDYFIMRPMKPYNGLIIELKIKPNKPTDLQLKFIETMNKEGYYALVCWSAEEAKQVVCDYLMISST
jgi:hypothetical protein